MNDGLRLLVGMVVAALIIALLLVARGERQRGEPVDSSSWTGRPAAAAVAPSAGPGHGGVG